MQTSRFGNAGIAFVTVIAWIPGHAATYLGQRSQIRGQPQSPSPHSSQTPPMMPPYRGLATPELCVLPHTCDWQMKRECLPAAFSAPVFVHDHSWRKLPGTATKIPRECGRPLCCLGGAAPEVQYYGHH